MSKRISVAQFQMLCDQFGKDKFIRQPVNIHPGRHPLKNKELTDIMKWLDANCSSPYYLTKESHRKTYVTDLVFYFMDEQDKMIFTLCFCEIFA